MTTENRKGNAATRAKNKYNAKAYDQFVVVVPTGRKKEIDEFVKASGYKSRNEFVVDAMNKLMGNIW